MVVPLTITPSDPLAKFLLLVPTTLCSAGLKVLVPEGGRLIPGSTTMVPFNRKTSPGHFGLLMALRKQAKNGVNVFSGVTDPDY